LLRVVETPRQSVAQASKLTRLLPLWMWPWGAGSANRAA